MDWGQGVGFDLSGWARRSSLSPIAWACIPAAGSPGFPDAGRLGCPGRAFPVPAFPSAGERLGCGRSRRTGRWVWLARSGATFQGVVLAHPICAERMAGEAGDERVVVRRVVLDCIPHAGEYLPFGDLAVLGVGPSGAEQASGNCSELRGIRVYLTHFGSPFRFGITLAPQVGPPKTEQLQLARFQSSAGCKSWWRWSRCMSLWFQSSSG